MFKDQKEGSKGGGGGYYWPVPAVWRSGGADPEFHQNGVYLSHLAALVFSGKKIATKVPKPSPNPGTHVHPQPLCLSHLAAMVLCGKKIATKVYWVVALAGMGTALSLAAPRG